MVEKDFINYIANSFSKEAIQAMFFALEKNELHAEAKSLNLFYNQRGKHYIEIPSNIWASKEKCFAGIIPPDSANEGDIWFDTVDLTAHILINNGEDWSEDTKGWYALHPVYKWQFEGFSHTVKIESHYKSFIPLRSNQPKKYDGTEYVSHITQLEAQAYASWFGKELASGELSNVLLSNFKKYIDEMLPGNLALWDAGIYTSGFAFANRKEHLNNSDVEDYDIDDEQERWHVKMNKFEAADNIGLLVFVPYNTGLSNSIPPVNLDDDLLILKNKADRNFLLNRQYDK